MRNVSSYVALLSCGSLALWAWLSEANGFSCCVCMCVCVCVCVCVYTVVCVCVVYVFVHIYTCRECRKLMT